MLVGFHVQDSPPGYRVVAPECADGTIFKFTSGWERAIEVKEDNPLCKVAVRHVVEQPMPTSNYEQVARDYFHGMVDPRASLWQAVDYIQGWNEFYAESQHWEEKKHWVATDIAFARVWYEEYRPIFPHIRFVNSEAPVGNSIPWQVAEASIRYKSMMGYHAYWPTRDKQITPADEWRYYSGRWEAMDDLYRSKGIKVDWFFGEMGPYESAITGWRHKKVLSRDMKAYKRTILYWIDKVRETLAYKQQRVHGGVLFTCGAPGSGPNWRYFDHDANEMKEIAIFVKEVMGDDPPPPPPVNGNRGAPRVQYAREVWVVPQDTKRQVWLGICAKALEGKHTVGWSPDDAGVGDLDRRKAVLWNIPPDERGGYLAWFSEHYPGVEVVFRDHLSPVTHDFNLTHWPATLKVVTQYFSLEEGHKGIDIGARDEDPIFAAAEGTISRVGWDDSGYGLHIRIDHGNDYETRYAHLKHFVPIDLKKGTKVVGGKIIGAANNTGSSDGNHLHFEVRKKGIALDPWEFLKHIRE